METNGRTRYAKVCNLLKPILGKKKTLGELQRRVMIDVGSSPSVIKESIQLMIDLGLIVETSHLIFKVVSTEAKI